MCGVGSGGLDVIVCVRGDFVVNYRRDILCLVNYVKERLMETVSGGIGGRWFRCYCMK